MYPLFWYVTGITARRFCHNTLDMADRAMEVFMEAQFSEVPPKVMM
jgi:hypothetical protein